MLRALITGDQAGWCPGWLPAVLLAVLLAHQ
jgi:hypothetical protein